MELACFTSGEKGAADPVADPAELGRLRRREAEAAAVALGAAVPVHFLGAVDGELEVTMAMRLAVARLVRTVRPDVVLGHDPWRRWLLHPDHRAAGLLTVDGVVAARDPTTRRRRSPLRRGLSHHRHPRPLSRSPRPPVGLGANDCARYPTRARPCLEPRRLRR